MRWERATRSYTLAHDVYSLEIQEFTHFLWRNTDYQYFHSIIGPNINREMKISRSEYKKLLREPDEFIMEALL